MTGVLLAQLSTFSTAGIGYFTTLFTQNFDPTKLLGLISLQAAIVIVLNEIVRPRRGAFRPVAGGIGIPAAGNGRRYDQAACCDGPMPRRAVRDVVWAAFVCFSNWVAQASQRAASWFQLARSSGLAVERAILRHSSACRRNSAAGSIFRSH
jgi:hypothetical protein